MYISQYSTLAGQFSYRRNSTTKLLNEFNYSLDPALVDQEVWSVIYIVKKTARATCVLWEDELTVSDDRLI